MVLRIQISFKTIKLGERKEDLAAIELSENTQTSFKTINQRKESLFLQTQVELKYRKEELECFDNLIEILLLLPRPLHSRQNGKPQQGQ